MDTKQSPTNLRLSFEGREGGGGQLSDSVSNPF